MKELKRTREITETYAYEAPDGTQFSTEQACKEYEKSAGFVIKAAMEQYVVAQCKPDDLNGKLPWPGDEDDVVCFDIKDAEALKAVNTFFCWKFDRTDEDFKKELISSSYIGKQVFVQFYCWDSDAFEVMGTVEEIIQSVRDCFEKVMHKEKKEEDYGF